MNPLENAKMALSLIIRMIVLSFIVFCGYGVFLLLGADIAEKYFIVCFLFGLVLLVVLFFFSKRTIRFLQLIRNQDSEINSLRENPLSSDSTGSAILANASLKQADKFKGSNLEAESSHFQEEERKLLELENWKKAALNMMEDWRESMEKQKHLERIKTEFLSVTSHELRTPITPMSSEVEMLLGEFFGKLNDEQKKSLMMIQRNLLQLDHLIEDILDISKMESGNLKFFMKSENLNEVLNGVFETMSIKAKARNIFMDMKAQTIPNFIFDKQRIIQVLNNLVNNAIKFTDSNGDITIEAEDNKDHVLVKVIDSGIGISKDDCTKLFQPFVQADSSMSRNYEGTGLGLAISRGIVNGHNGNIWVESTIGKGSVFQFLLPYDLKKKNTKVELFSFDKEKSLKRFESEIADKGYKLIKHKENDLLQSGVLDSSGRLRYDMALDDIEERGYIEKINHRE